MRTIETSSIFKRDFKRELKGKYKKVLSTEFTHVVECLVNDKQLDVKYKNHPLTGNWGGYWECHLKPDLLLIYKKIESELLLLARMGSHSELF